MVLIFRFAMLMVLMRCNADTDGTSSRFYADLPILDGMMLC
jgi:hypothetical protein